MKPVTLYYRSWCPYSAATLSFLFHRGADVVLVNLEQHPEVHEELMRHADGNVVSPTLQYGDEWHIEPALEEIHQLLRNWGLPREAGVDPEG
ncbi:MAG TPA: glutaredoxin family protein [Chloroflexota bacterium]|nr:glutaredoxin family protein [Chloroflexota bacterium]